MRGIAVAFFCGVLWVQQASSLPSLWWVMLCLPVPFVAYFYPKYRTPVLLLCVFVLALFWTAWRAQLLLDTTLDPALEGQTLVLQGKLDALPVATTRGVRVTLAVQQAWLQGKPVSVPPRVRLSSYRHGWRPQIGEHWRVHVRLKRPHGFQNPGGFDYEAYLLQQRVRATGYVRHKPAPLRVRAAGPWGLGQLRQRLAAGITQALGENRYSAIIIALCVGERHAISSQDWQLLRATGTNHLMAISGLHIGLVAGLVFFLLRWSWSRAAGLALYWPAPKAAATGAAIAAVTYAALAGFSLPTQRAMIMLAVLMLAVVTARRFVPSQVLALALFLVLLYDPLAPLAAGFWLSFLAVALIAYSLKARSHSAGAQRWWRHWGRVQWGLALGLAPLLLWWFQQVSLVAPVANLVAVPVFAFWVVPLSLLGGVCELLLPSWLGAGLLHLAQFGLSVLWVLLALLGQTAISVWQLPSPSVGALLIAMLGALWLLAPRAWPARWLGLVLCLPLLWPRTPSLQTGEFAMTLLDVGQGLSVVVRTRQHALVFDTGPRFSPSFDTGSAVVLPYLIHSGIHRLDALVISHGDNDHIGGSDSLLAAMPTQQIYSSVPQRIVGASDCYAGLAWHWDGVDFRFLNPPRGLASQDNNGSCVLHIRSPYRSALVTADIELFAEQELLQHGAAELAADILVVPHHGSKTSSSPEFVAAVNPKIALFPVGYRNRYRHPHPAVLQRYRAQGSEIYQSPQHGAIELRALATRIERRSYRDYHRRYWHRRH